MLSAALAGAGALLWWRGLSLPQLPPHIWWPLLAALFCLTERFVVLLPFGRENHTVSFGEAPLVLGLIFVAPNDLVLAALVGTGFTFLVLNRAAPIKTAFNAANWLLQVTVAIAAYDLALGLLRTREDPLSPAGWLAALLATQLVHVLSGLAVFAAISLRERVWQPRPLPKNLALGSISTLVVTDLALVTALLVRRETSALALLAVLAVLTFALFRAYHVQRQRYGRLELLYAFTRSVDQSLQHASVRETVLAEARALLRAQRSEIVLVPEGAGTAHPHLGSWWLPALDGEVLLLPRGRHGEPSESLRGTGFIDGMAAPLREEGRIIGALLVTDRVDDVSTFDREDAKLFQALAGHAGVALANSALVERVREAAQETEHLSLHDPLTGLPNRLHFLQRLERRLEGGDAAVVLMDLDRFKEVNDTLGYDVGDELLRQVGRRLRRLEHEQTVVARLGDDEFAVLLAGDEVHVEGMVQRVHSDFSRPFVLGTIQLDVTASVGISVAPRDGSSAALLLRRAEVAMYDAKRQITGVAHYSSDNDPYSARRLSLIGDLARALDEGGLQLHYQPQAEPGSGRVTGVEALVRWRHAVWGNIPPDEFIPLAEQTGLIRPLTRFVLQTAVRQCAEWRAAGTPVQIAVNISMRNLLEGELADAVARLLVQEQLPPGLLKLEVTESAIVADPTHAVVALERLVELGISISVDDFGTGYSSLTRLRRLPVHEVKIDRTFVRNLADSSADLAIVRAVISLGHDLGLTVVAEGVEDERTWRLLGELGCDLLQGYLLSRPMPADDMTRWLAERFASFATRLRPADDEQAAIPAPADEQRPGRQSEAR
jgi:diguanylate cyclase (GGDEF)-like protein